MVRVGILVFVPDFSGKAFSFSSKQLCWLWFCHKQLLLCWDIFPPYAHWLRAFCHEWMLIFVSAFSASVEDDHMVLSFPLLWYITMNDLCTLNHPCDLGMNLTWSWSMMLFYVLHSVCLFLLTILHLIFIKVLACSFLFCRKKSGFGIRVMVASQNPFASAPFSPVFWNSWEDEA